MTLTKKDPGAPDGAFPSCPATAGDDERTYRCRLPAGHEGAHRDGDMAWVTPWDRAAQPVPGFTPGPWSIDEESRARTGMLYVRSLAFGEREPVVAEIDPHGSIVLEGTAVVDARLITAATDLYEALRALIPEANGEHKHQCGMGFCDPFHIAIAKARAALAKAEGRSAAPQVTPP